MEYLILDWCCCWSCNWCISAVTKSAVVPIIQVDFINSTSPYILDFINGLVVIELLLLEDGLLMTELVLKLLMWLEDVDGVDWVVPFCWCCCCCCCNTLLQFKFSIISLLFTFKNELIINHIGLCWRINGIWSFDSFF